MVPKKRKSLIKYLQQILKSGPALIIVNEVTKGIVSPLLVSLFHYTSCPVFSPILVPALVSEMTLYYSSDLKDEKCGFPFKTE